MKYKNINIKSFRGIKEFELNNASKVNVILGQNNSGKSSILEAIFLLTGYNNPQLVLTVDVFRNLLHNELNDFRFIFYNLDYNSRITLEADLYPNNENRKLEIIPKAGKKGKSVQKIDINSDTGITPSAGRQIAQNSMPSIDDNLVNTLEFKSEVKTPHSSRQHNSATITVNKTLPNSLDFINDPGEKKIVSFKAIYHGASVKFQDDIVQRLESLLIEKRKTALVNDLKIIEKNIIDIITTKNSMIYVDIGAERMLPANLMGDGFFKYLNIITKMHEVKGGVILIDEIENGLHFSSLKNLWRIILHYCNDFDIQVFVTTHSKEALIYLKEVLEEIEMKAFQEEVKCYTISKLNDGILKAYPYDFSSFEYAIENDVEIRGEI